MVSDSAGTQRAKAIFGKAEELVDPAERAAYLDETCRGNDPLRAEVERLLAAADEAGVFMAAPAVTPVHMAAVEQPVAEGPGTVIGPYKLLEQIGEGGFGLVFVAEQQRPVHRQVGLKIIKPGMDTRQVIARFEAERQALALMDHPNIAKVFDAGATESGRPYFVMELVKGAPITEYCDEHQLTVRDRLKLFISLCRAIQHAHQKGIIHRDVKPTNVLVTLHDGRPVPKVIDFGVAKALSQQLTERTIYTQLAQMIGTPLYMSPEQAEMNGLDVDTRSDIYSLGVVLYELLTGTTPFDGERFKQAAAEEVRRLVREEEPLKPSSQLSHSGDRLTRTAAQRHIEPAQLTKLVRGELDWIVMKCLEKDRNRRYETANAFAADIEHYLHDEPVQACPPSALYRLGKFTRRNKLTLLTAAVITAILIVATVVSVWEATVARRAEALAEQRLVAETQAREQATAVNDLLVEALQSANPAAANGPDYTVRQLLDDIAQRIEGRYQNQPAAEAAVRQTIGNHYSSLGLQSKAESHLKRALELKEQLYGPVHPEVAASLLAEGWNRLSAGDASSAEADARRALEIHRRLGLRNMETVGILYLLQNVYKAQSRITAAEEVDKEALRIAREEQVSSPASANVFILDHAADIMFQQGKYAEAEQLAREVVSLHRKLEGDKHTLTAWALLSLSRSCLAQQKLDEAEKAVRESLDIWREDYGGTNFGCWHALRNLAFVLSAKGDDAGLKALSKDVIALTRQTIELEPDDKLQLFRALLTVAVLNEVGVVEANEVVSELCALLMNATLDKFRIPAGDLNKAAQLLVNYPVSDPIVANCAVRIAEVASQLSPDDWTIQATLGVAYCRAGDLLAQTGRPKEADAYLRKAKDVYKRVSDTQPDTVEAWAERGDFYRLLGEFEDMANDYSHAIELDPNNSWYWHERAYAHMMLGEHRESVADHTKAIELSDREPLTRLQRANSYFALGESEKAVEDCRHALELDKEMPFGDAGGWNYTAWLLVRDPVSNPNVAKVALTMAKKAAAMEPGNGMIENTLGVAQYRTGNFQNAVEALSNSIELQGENSCDLFFLAMSEWQLGNHDAAQQWYDKAVELTGKNNPKDEQLHRFRAEAEELMKITDEQPTTKARSEVQGQNKSGR